MLYSEFRKAALEVLLENGEMPISDLKDEVLSGKKPADEAWTIDVSFANWISKLHSEKLITVHLRKLPKEFFELLNIFTDRRLIKLTPAAFIEMIKMKSAIEPRPVMPTGVTQASRPNPR